MPSLPTFDLDTRQLGLGLPGPSPGDHQCAFTLSELVFKAGNHPVGSALACYCARDPLHIRLVLGKPRAYCITFGQRCNPARLAARQARLQINAPAMRLIKFRGQPVRASTVEM
jgi:hypothetical protein